MKNKYNSFLYTFDLIGPAPKLFVYNNDRYKSLLSSFISIIIISFSIIFIIFSLIEYFKYKNPTVIYSKSSDDIIKRTIFLKDSFLMFQLIDSSTAQIINDSIAYFEGYHSAVYDDGHYDSGILFIEKCEFEKNINLRYKELLKERLNFGRPIETFYCISLKHDNISLFYHPRIGYNSINLVISLKDNNNYIPEKIQALIISENNIIDHQNKGQPISESFIYHITSAFSSKEYTNINYAFQYIQYESDNGFIYSNNKNFSGISFLNMDFNRKMTNDYNLEKDLKESKKSKIGTISFEVNKSNYDNYKRSYQKLQSLLAEIMSVINLFFEVGRQISAFLCSKKMSKDIIISLFNSEEKKDILNRNNINNLFKSHEKNKISSERKNIKQQSIDKLNNTDYQAKNDKFRLNVSKDNMMSKNDKKNENINKIEFKKINYYFILKSYFCFNDKMTKLINIYHNIIIENMCIERILERFYNLEKVYHFFSNKEKEKLKSFKNRRFKEIKKYIYRIDDEKNKFNSIKK